MEEKNLLPVETLIDLPADHDQSEEGAENE